MAPANLTPRSLTDGYSDLFPDRASELRGPIANGSYSAADFDRGSNYRGGNQENSLDRGMRIRSRAADGGESGVRELFPNAVEHLGNHVISRETNINDDAHLRRGNENRENYRGVDAPGEAVNRDAGARGQQRNTEQINHVSNHVGYPEHVNDTSESTTNSVSALQRLHPQNGFVMINGTLTDRYVPDYQTRGRPPQRRDHAFDRRFSPRSSPIRYQSGGGGFAGRPGGARRLRSRSPRQDVRYTPRGRPVNARNYSPARGAHQQNGRVSPARYQHHGRASPRYQQNGHVNPPSRNPIQVQPSMGWWRNDLTNAENFRQGWSLIPDDYKIFVRDTVGPSWRIVDNSIWRPYRTPGDNLEIFLSEIPMGLREDFGNAIEWIDTEAQI